MGFAPVCFTPKSVFQANAEKVGRGRLEDLKNENFHWEWQPIAQEAQERSAYYEEESEDGLKERPRQARLSDTDSENYFFTSESKNKARKVAKKADSKADDSSSEDKPKRDRKINSKARAGHTEKLIFVFTVHHPFAHHAPHGAHAHHRPDPAYGPPVVPVHHAAPHHGPPHHPDPHPR